MDGKLVMSDSHNYRLIVGRYIKRQIDELGFTQKQIAELAGINPSNMSRIILGKYSVSLDILERVCCVIGLQIAFVEPFKRDDLHQAISMALVMNRNFKEHGLSVN